MKKLTLTLLCSIFALSLNAQLININWEKEINKIVEAVLSNPTIEKAIADIEAQYKSIIDDYNRLNGELNVAIEQCKSIEQRIKGMITYIGVAALLVCIVIPLAVGFLLYRRIKRSRFFRMGDNLSKVREELAKLNIQYAELLKAGGGK